MDFSGQYLTYNEYTELGGTLAETPFNLLEFEARKQIDLRTQKRLDGVSDIPQEVKLCMFHLIEKVNSYAIATENSGGNIASENTDGYSVSYVTANQIKEIIKSKNAELQDIILVDLFGITVNNEHLIYLGVK